ncbi:hypothetical protein GGR01_003152 [Acetobacter oeni]|nr:hypothetical protein [Acetobacter oeni]
MEQSWRGPVSELSGMIAAAVGTIEHWKRRLHSEAGQTLH